MKRQVVLNKILSSLTDSDIVIFSGSNLCKEAYKNDKPGFLYLADTYGLGPSLAMGIAMGTDKRVFSFVNDDEFLRSFASTPNMAVSGCKNLFYVILVSGIYQSVGTGFTIFDNIKAPKSCMFNLGFSVFDYTKYFTDKSLITKIPLLFERIRGPMVLFISVDKGINKKLDDVHYSKVELRDRISKFIQSKDIKSSLYPQSTISQIN